VREETRDLTASVAAAKPAVERTRRIIQRLFPMVAGELV
jgi:hypothetical protein